MKLIPKKQNGGNFLSSFASYNIMNFLTPLEQPRRQSSRESKEEDTTKGKITEKDLFLLLDKVDGLPNEMQELTNDVQSMYRNIALFDSEWSSTELSSLYALTIFKLKRANFNKKEYDKAFTNVNNNKGLNSVAVTDNGMVLAYDKDRNLKYLSVLQALKNDGEYLLLTNSNLLQLRAENPNFVDNNEILSIVHNGIGIDKVREHIKSAMTDLGTSGVTLEGYTTKLKENIIGGILILDDLSKKSIASGMTLDGLYKTKVITKEQSQLAEAALNFIYNTLSTLAKTVLLLLSGYADNPVEGAKALILQYITSSMTSSKSINLDYEENLNIDGTKKSSSSSGKGPLDEKSSMAVKFLAGLGLRLTFEINPGTEYSIIVNVNTLPLTDKSDNALPIYSSLVDVSAGNYKGILDFSKASMAGKKIINPSTVLIPDANANGIDFPVDVNGMPNLKLLEVKREADDILTQEGIDLRDKESIKLNVDRINAVYLELNLNAAYDRNGELLPGWKTFCVINGVANKQSLGQDIFDNEGEGILYRKITDKTEIKFIDERISEANENYSPDHPWAIFGEGDPLIESTIWIPMYNNPVNSRLGLETKISSNLSFEEMYLKVYGTDYQLNLRSRWNNPGNNP